MPAYIIAGKIIHPEGHRNYLVLVTFTPFDSMFNRPTLIIILDREIVLHWHQTSCEEVIVTGLYEQSKRIASEDVLLTDRPC